MKAFLDKDFLLQNKTAKRLFHDCCENMPICDYHCHLSPKEIYENKPVTDIAELWLGADHYKWRLMRSCGIDEEYCTGSKPNREKFEKFAFALQYALGNPIYHWAHLELQRYFGIGDVLSAKTAADIYERANSQMAGGAFTPQNLIKNSRVSYICTTDDPADDLQYHKLLKGNDFGCAVLPTFRPDRALNIELPGFVEYISSLSSAAGVQINSFDNLVSALYARADFFNAVGCRVSDQAFSDVPFKEAPYVDVNRVFTRALSGGAISAQDAEIYKTAIMAALGEKYHSLGWVMEVHIGAMRNNNTAMFNKLGADTGFDSVGDCNFAFKLSRFLDGLCKKGTLPKTILFNLNGRDNDVLASMLGNFQGSEAESKIQFGPAWWFLDTKDGIERQLRSLGNYGVLGKFVGMETDSRSFTSYARHEYFRRILCGFIGSYVESGMYPQDWEMLNEIVRGICYNNAVKYFNFE
ncbi:MAG: glucuronate isomerase [Clostridiales bacterium]|nr:glucuronate isomerase [Clostridiales bacterium]